ncbi:MAG TPA: serine protease, partial [Marmoricola sp.]|nr:serine protease [Marmoricola sp.]
MNILDWSLVVLAVAYAISGYWQGFVAGAFATVGLILGGILGIWVAPLLLGEAKPSLAVSLWAL